MRTLILLALLIALCGLAGCGRPDTTQSSGTGTATSQQPSAQLGTPTALRTTIAVPRIGDRELSEYVTPRSLKERIAISNAIVIGQVTGRGKIINGARDPNDPTKPSSSIFSVGQVYHFQVQRYLKGSGPQTLDVAQSEGMIFASPESVTEDDIARAKAARGQIPLRQGPTYLLFLQRVDGFDQDYYAGGMEPWRYILSPDGNATPEALDEALRAIPSDFLPDHNAPLLPQVERQIQAERTAAPTP